ncbi:MAG: HlyC/CorC family transporter [Pseudomonadota bacterium]
MDASLWLTLLAIIPLIVLSGFFSGSETALTAVSKARMRSLEANGDPRAGLVGQLIEERDRLIGALLVGNNLVNILASALATSLFISVFGPAGVAYATLAMTVIVVVFAEVMPKFWAISNPDRFALRVSPLARGLVIVFSPVVGVVNRFVRMILTRLGVKLDADVTLLSARDEIRGAVDMLHQEGSVVKDERDRLSGLLDLHELEISDVMIHRTNMASLNADEPPAELYKQVLDSPFTRLPVWQDETDNIIGVLHVKDLLRSLAANGQKIDKLDVRKIISSPWFVPETTSLQDQLNAFLRRQAHIALVVDEYGEVEGLVTLEDILEEIVGEIADEHDEAIQGVHPQSDGSVVVDGSVPVRDLNRALDWDLPDEEATTIAGLVIHESQMIPQEKQTFTFHDKRFVVLKRVKNRVTQLRIRSLPR